MALLVMFIGTGVGGFCGWLANTKLRPTSWMLNGMFVGLLSGWLAAVLWCRVILGQIRSSHRPHKGLRRDGARWGTVVGLLAALIVFAWLMLVLVVKRHSVGMLPRLVVWWLMAELFGGLIGAGVGYFCGWLAYIAAKFALPLPPLDPNSHPQRPI